MQNKKGFTLIELMIVVAIVAILAMVAVPMYQKYIERSRNTASQNLLQQISLAEMASQTDAIASGSSSSAVVGYVFVSDPGDTGQVEDLMFYGFRPDPNVGFRVEKAIADDGFVAFACHKAAKSQAYVYDNVSGGGVQVYNPSNTYAHGSTAFTDLYIFMMKASSSTAELDGSAKTLKIDGDGKSTGTVS